MAPLRPTADLRLTPALVIGAAELAWRFSRSSGPGGQNVNTTDSRVELVFDLAASAALPPTILTDPRSASLANRPEVTSKAPAPESVEAPTRTGRPEAEASVSSVEAPTKLAVAPASIVSAVRRTAEAPKATGPSKRIRSRTTMS